MLLRSITLLATAAVWVGVTGATAPQPEPPAVHVEWVHPAAPQTEDSPGWSCATMGNRICGPGNPEGLAAGCYEDLEDEGTLVVAWTRYDDPRKDALWGQLNPTRHCLDIPGTHAVALRGVDAQLAA